MTSIPSSVIASLAKPFELTADQIAFYQQNRFIKLKQVFDEETISFFNEVIGKRVEVMNHQNTPLEQRSTYGKAFLQLFNLWKEDELVKAFVFSERLAKIAADLMQVYGVRIYHDQALFKEGGGGITPWHADQYYWPLETDKTVTAWIDAGGHVLVSGRVMRNASGGRHGACGRRPGYPLGSRGCLGRHGEAGSTRGSRASACCG
jgi:hypothetical protein